MTTMYDSDVPADIPEDAEAVALYVVNSEAPPATAADYARFTAATVKRRIVPTAVNEGDTLDIENGDASIPQAPGWVAKRVASGELEADLWLYIERSRFADLVTTMGVGYQGAYWVADWTGAPHELEEVPPGARVAAVQYANPDTSGGHYDLSTVYETAPPAPPAPEPGGFDVSTVPTIQQGSSGDVVKTWQSILNGRGNAGLVVDGAFGPQTEAHTLEWQKVFNLTEDGIVGPQTWASAFA